MNTQKCIILEDNTDALDVLEIYISRLPRLELIGSFSLAMDALQFLSQNQVDILFVDVNLPDYDGFDFLNSIPYSPFTIMTTANILNAKNAFDLGVSDFLLKPFCFDRFVKAINRVSAPAEQLVAQKSKEQFIFLKVGLQIQKFDFDSIQYVAAYGTYTKVYVSDKCHLVTESISKLAQKLPTESFLRIHKSYIAPLQKITCFDSKNIWIDKVMLPIGATFQKNLESTPFAITA
jgi:DNA-binding LytR/AlgR family response regulator